MLILSRKKNESIIIDDNIEISVVEIKGDQIKLGIKAPRSVKVFRQEVYLAIQNANKEAVKTSSVLPDMDIFKNP